MIESHRFFENVNCEYYPCHEATRINCLFCFCPLYHMQDCGGSYHLLDNGIKDCSGCISTHEEAGYDFVIEKLKGAVAQLGERDAGSVEVRGSIPRSSI